MCKLKIKWILFQFEDPYRKPAKIWRYCDFLPQPASQGDDLGGTIVLQSYLNIFKVTQVTAGDLGRLNSLLFCIFYLKSFKNEIKIKTATFPNFIKISLLVK